MIRLEDLKLSESAQDWELEIDEQGFGDITKPFDSAFRCQIMQYDPTAGTFALVAKKSAYNNKWTGKWVSSSSNRGIGVWNNRDDANLFSLKNGMLTGKNWSANGRNLGLTKKESYLGFWDPSDMLPINVAFAVMKERPAEAKQRDIPSEPRLYLREYRDSQK